MSTLTDSLRGKRVVVIGGTSGMGRGAVEAALDAGAHVVSAGRRPLTKRLPPPEGSRIQEELIDVNDETSVKSFFEKVGALDHLLVTSAPSPGSIAPILEQDLASAQRLVTSKLFGSWLAARWAAPRIPALGSITFLTGGAAVKPKRGTALVSATFAAIETLARGLAIELAPIRVNVLRPGYTDSEMWSFLDSQAKDELFDKVRRLMPVGRIGTTADLGHAAVFLMQNPQMTGSVLEITGGETLVDGL